MLTLRLFCLAEPFSYEKVNGMEGTDRAVSWPLACAKASCCVFAESMCSCVCAKKETISVMSFYLPFILIS